MITAEGLGYTFIANDMASGPIQRLNGQVKSLGKNSEAAQLAYNRNMALITQGTKQLLIGGIALMGINSLTKSYGRALEKAAIDAGIATQFDPREAAAGLETLGAAGMNAKDAIATLTPVLDLAAASLGQLGVAEASANVVGVLNAFGDSTDMASKRVDQLVRVTQLSNFQARDFSIAISQAAAQAAAGDQTFESMTATLGMLRNTNLDASSSATAYREAIRRLAGDKRSLKKLNELGIDTLDKETGKIKDMGRIIAELIPRVEQLDAQEKNLALKRIFGVRGMKTYNAFFMSYKKAMKEGKVEIGDFAGAHRQLVQGLENAGGAAARTREKLLATAEGRRILLQGSIETFKVVAGKAFVPAVLPVLKQMTDSLNVLIRVFAKIPGPIRGFLSHFTGAIAVMLTFSGLVKVMIGIKGLMGLAAAQNTTTAASTRLTIAQARQNMVLARGQGIRARATAQFGLMRASMAGMLPFVGLAVAGVMGYFSMIDERQKKQRQRQKEIEEQQKRISAEYRRSAEGVHSIGRAAASTVGKLIKRGKQKQLLQVQETVRKNIVKAESAEAKMLTNVAALHNKNLSKKKRAELQALQVRLQKEAMSARKIVEVYKHGELQIRAGMLQRIPAHRRTERQNATIVAAASARIQEMKRREGKLGESINRAMLHGQTETVVEYTKRFHRLHQQRRRATFAAARQAGYRGRDFETAEAAVTGGGRDVLRDLRARGRIQRPDGVDPDVWARILKDPAAISGGLGLVSSEQKRFFEERRQGMGGLSRLLSREERHRQIGDPVGEDRHESARRMLGIGSDEALTGLQRTIITAMERGLNRANIHVSIDGESVPTKKANSNERGARGQASQPQEG
jgi:TP901 family phage tail tape measure protein